MLGITAGMDLKALDSYAARCCCDMPVVVNNRCLGFYSADKLWRSRSCRSSQVSFPCRCPEADSHGLPVRKTMETPQLQYFSWWSMPLLRMSFLTCLSLCNDRPGWPRQCRKLSGSTAGAVPLRLWTSLWSRSDSPGSAGRCLRLVHRRDVQVLRRGAFAAVLQHFSVSVHLDVEAQGGGDAGSLTPRCSATPIRCNRAVVWRNTPL